MGIIRSNDCDSSVKQAAGQTIINIIENRPKLFAKKQLVGPVLAALMEMIAAQDASAAGAIFSYNGPNLAEDNDDEDFSPEMDIQKLAQTIIDYMAIEIPSKYFVDTALNLCSQVRN